MSKKISFFHATGAIFFALALFLVSGTTFAKSMVSLPTGGSSFETAAGLQPEVYQGVNLKEREDLYYSIQASAGQEINIEASGFSESGCTIYLYDSNQEELTSNYGENPKISWLSGDNKNSNYYLKIENDASDVKSFSLTFSLTSRYDASSQTDASGSFDGATNVALGNHNGYLVGNANITNNSGDDDTDFYKVELKKGTTYNFKLTPPSKTELTLSLYDSNRQLLKEESSTNKGAAVSTFLAPSSDTNVFVSVFNNRYAYQDELVNYQLEITTSAAVAAYYSCEDGYCQSVGEFVSLEECQKTTTKACFASPTCNGKCEGSELSMCVKSSDCPTDTACVSGQCLSTGGFVDSDVLPDKFSFWSGFSGGILTWGLFAGVCLFIWIIIYVYLALCLQFIAKKTNTSNGWFAWIPILNLILMIQCAKKPMWWIIMFFIPLVNIVFGILVWMAIAEKRGKPSWVGILVIVPVIGIVIPGYLAFSGDKKVEIAQP